MKEKRTNISAKKRTLGSVTVEYLILSVFIGLALISSVTIYRDSIIAAFERVAEQISAIGSNDSEPVDVTAPEPSPIFGQKSDGTILENGQYTNDNRPRLSGTAEPGSIVSIYNGTVLIGQVMTDPSGEWRFTMEALPEGEYTFTTTVTDNSGNISDTSPEYSLNIDLTSPPMGVITSVIDSTGNVIGNLSSGQVTDASQPLIGGVAEVGSIVSIFNNGEQIGQVDTSPMGIWNFVPLNPFQDGPNNITLTVTDHAGNVSVQSAVFTIVVDTSSVE